jgi:hypothetical protein
MGAFLVSDAQLEKTCRCACTCDGTCEGIPGRTRFRQQVAATAHPLLPVRPKPARGWQEALAEGGLMQKRGGRYEWRGRR